MTSASRSLRVGIVTLPALVMMLAERGWAQDPALAPSLFDRARFEGPVALVLILATGLLLMLGLVGKVLDLRLKRDGEAVAVKGLIADALGRDPNLFGLPLSATVRVPFWSGSPVTIRVAGEVPSDELKRVALRSVKRAAKAELLVHVRIRSRIGVVPSASTSSELRRARSG